MKRDWDVIRSVLLEVEALKPSQADFQYTAVFKSDDEDSVRALHAFLLYERGYLKGIDSGSLHDRALISPELTMDGADLLDSIREQKLWDKIKEIAKDRGVGLAFDTVKALAGIAFTQLMS